MATTTVSYGSISIVDVTDVGELSIYPKSNLPQSIIYSPDQNSFTPNWGSNNLILSPSIWYGGEQLSTSDNNVTVTWSRREGIGAVTALTTGETISDGTMEVGGETIPKGTLVVNQNKFTENSTMITYIVAVSYQEPTLSQALTAQGEITFTMTKQASSVKSATITGESVFKYNGDGTIKGTSTITLNGRVTGSGVNISAWQYQQSNGSWATYPNSGTSPTLTVNESHSVFTNDKCVIKLVTTNNDIYDYHTITKLRDGAAGTDTISAVLTNEDQMIPVNSSGVADYSDAVSRIIIYESGEDITSQWSINVSYDTNNLTVNTSTTTVANDTVAITNMVGSTGTINFTATKNGHDPILKQFSVIKIESGADGQSPIVYSLEPSTLALNKTIGNTPTFTPASVRFYSYQTQNQTKSIYKGRFKIYENILAKDITPSTEAKYTSSSDENDGYRDYTPVTGKNCTSIVCVLFESGGTSKQLDIQTVAVTTDGQTGGKGDKGDDGTDALNIIVGNSYDGIPVDGDGKVTSTYTILIPFAGYQGTTKVATTVVNPPSLFGITPTVTNATTSADGSIQYVITAGTAISNDNGVITFTFRFTEANKTVTYDYSWGKARQGKDGTNGINAVILQLGTPNGGNIIENGTGTVTIEAALIDGATDVTNSATYIWKKFENGSYSTISGQTAKTLTVTNSMVDGYASFQCIAHYNDEDYIQYMSVLDKQDPIQVTLLSSVGDKLVNGNGVGAIYAMVYRNGKELDPIKSERFVDTLPTSGNKNGDYCYLLDSTAKTVTLYKYTTKWNVATDTYTGTYNWYYRDKDGNPTTTGTPSAGGKGAKVIYIDGDLVDKKLTIDVKVTI
jgi:hypothetical protein